jgi:hypothetical protein
MYTCTSSSCCWNGHNLAAEQLLPRQSIYGPSRPREHYRPPPQSRQSTNPSLQSSELGLPNPVTRRRMCTPPPFGSGGDTLACGRGGGGVPTPTRDRHCGTHVLRADYHPSRYISRKPLSSIAKLGRTPCLASPLAY